MKEKKRIPVVAAVLSLVTPGLGNGKEHLGFKEFYSLEYEPNVVSKKTGVPVDTIIRLAREFSTSQPSLAIGYRDRPFHQMAVSILNGLTGSIDATGGILIPRNIPYQAFPPFKKDALAQKGLIKKGLTEEKDFRRRRITLTFLPEICALGETL